MKYKSLSKQRPKIVILNKEGLFCLHFVYSALKSLKTDRGESREVKMFL